MLKGIDVSRWQPDNCIKLVQNEVDFVICKLTQGVKYGYINDGLNKANLIHLYDKLLGFYHFATTRNAIQEADYFCDQVLKSGYLGKCLLVLDYESDAIKNGPAWIVDWVNQVTSRLGVIPLIYSSSSVIKSQGLIGVARSLNAGLWVSQYSSSQIKSFIATNPPFSCTMFQFTSNGRIGKFNNDLDLDYFYGDRLAYLKYCKVNSDLCKV